MQYKVVESGVIPAETINFVEYYASSTSRLITVDKYAIGKEVISSAKEIVVTCQHYNSLVDPNGLLY